MGAITKKAQKEAGTFVIIASGPSLTQEDVDYCKDKAKVLVINNNYQLAPWADYLYACDFKWWKEYKPEFKGIKYTQDARVKTIRDDVTYIASAREPGLSREPNLIHQGANSGYQALNLVYHLGADKVILLGYDMGATGNTHWHGDHPNGMANPSTGNWPNWIENFEQLAIDLKEEDVEVINCTRQTALTCFRRASLVSALSSEQAHR